jgi:DNA end-binding protein Ku
MRSTWTGAIQFGPLTVPVKLGSSVKENKLDLHMVRDTDGSPIRFTRVAEGDGKEVEWDHVAKGYDAPDGSLVVLKKPDFEAAFGPKNRVATVLMFTDAANIPPMANATNYWIQPNTGGEKSYALLAAELQRQGKVGVISFAMRERVAVAVLRPHDGYLSLEKLEWDADLIKPDFTAPVNNGTEQEQELTKQLIEIATDKYDHTAQEDPSRAALAAVIQGKIERGEVIAAPPRPDNVGAPADLTAQLQAAVAAQKAKAPAKVTTEAPKKARTTRRSA